jgi:hypothetical protein
MDDAIMTIKTVETAGTGLAIQLRDLEVADTISYERGGELLKAAKTYLAKVAEVMEPIIK